MAKHERPSARSVYFIRSEAMGMVKIGVANDPAKRLASLQTGSADRLSIAGGWWTDSAPELEQRLHDALWPHRVHGEWFRESAATRSVMGPTADGVITNGLFFEASPYVEPTAVCRLPRWRDGETMEDYVDRIEPIALAQGFEITRT